LLSRDLKRLEKAIKSEIQVEESQGIELTPSNLEQDVEEHNKNKPWWRRLARYLRDEFQTLFKGVLRKGVEEYLFPAVKKQFLS
jgi:hypothetical protein